MPGVSGAPLGARGGCGGGCWKCECPVDSPFLAQCCAVGMTLGHDAPWPPTLATTAVGWELTRPARAEWPAAHCPEDERRNGGARGLMGLQCRIGQIPESLEKVDGVE